jgi:sensor domain CHASE-containing protein/nitrogen-specific signal transduction histidine kinase/ActR/RegA family two-component response regulator
MKRRILFDYLLPAFLVAILLAGAWFGESVNNARYRAEVRAAVQQELSLVRHRIEGSINGDIQLVKGLVSVITLEPAITQARFEIAAKPLMTGNTMLRNIAAAPDMVIQLMYPLAGNEKAIGLDYRRTPGQFASAQKARDTGQIVLAGPFELAQGGIALAARMPVQIPQADGGLRFWGLVSAVINIEQLYAVAGLNNPDLPINVAIRGRDAAGPDGEVFFGPAALFDANPVLSDIRLPSGSWQLAGAPRSGWPTQAANPWPFRLTFALGAFCILAAYLSIARAARKASAAQRVAEKANAEVEAQRNHLEVLVSERTRELGIAKEAAETANIAKSAFIANMSHEIRTPLNAIAGMAHLMKRAGLSEDQADRIGKIETASDHLLEIINAVLDLSKIEAGKFTLEQAPVDIQSLLNNVLSILLVRASEKGLAFTADNLITGPVQLLGDQTRLQQGLINFASNGIKFTERGHVAIRARAIAEDNDSMLVRFEVEDTGIGIADTALRKLFAAFEQADSTTTRKYGGTGLGLAITHKLAQLMGGDAGATSQPGVGSCFWFSARLLKNKSMPAGPGLPAAADSEARLRQQHAGKRILLAEDEPINREIAGAMLADAGLIVDFAETGREALQQAQQHDYALILMDMQMPEMDGLEATRLIRRLPHASGLPIIALTANAFAEDKARCLAAGMNDFVTKPIEPEILYDTVLRHLADKTG